jgi:oxygen-independent coproporphyrinogen-3 oxidase
MKAAYKVALALRHPLDFTLQYPPRREYFQDSFTAPVDATMCGEASKMLLYCHVPFCKAKCYYCNFAVDVRPDAALHRRYVDMLVRQLQAAEELLAKAEIPGIDIGGGTPTILPTEQLLRIMAALAPFKARSPAARPISIETTPVIAANDLEKLKALAQAGVDRISMGLQSTNAETLRAVNRAEQQAVGMKALENLLGAGFKRVSVDLIFALPGQTAEHWLLDLKRVIALRPDAVTTYDCLYRGKGRALTKRTADKPTPLMYGKLYDVAYTTLVGAGYHAAYGSVNFSLHKGETGTSAYFEGRLLDGLPYLGLGNYASSLYRDNWWFAPYGVNDWMRRIEGGNIFPVGNAYQLPMDELMAKYLLLSLNFGFIDAERFRSVFGCEFAETFSEELDYAEENCLLRRDGQRYYVAYQFSHMPLIRSLFYSGQAMTWLKRYQPDFIK